MELIFASDKNSIGECLCLSDGDYSFVGSGGKTSLINSLASELPCKKVVITTTTHIYVPSWCAAVDPVNADSLDRFLEKQRVIAVGSASVAGKLATPKISFETLRNKADIVLNEADGSKGYPVKVPNSTEPVYPSNVGNIVCVAGMSALGKLKSEACFRYNGEDNDSPINEEDVFRFVCGKHGVLWNMPEGVPLTVVLNQADDHEKEDAAYRISQMMTQDPRVQRIVIVSLKYGFGGKYARYCERRG